MAQMVPHPIRPPSSEELVIGPGEEMESDQHFRQQLLLVDSLEYGWRGRTDFFVGGWALSVLQRNSIEAK